MIALPHLVFAGSIGLAALAAWPLLTDPNDRPLQYAQAVILGLLTGFVLSVVIP